MKRITRFALLLTVLALITTVEASAPALPSTFVNTMQEVESILLQIGSALGALMIAIEGVKWVSAQSPQDRESAKKGVIYVMIGLMLLKGSENIVLFLLSFTAII